MLFEGSMTVSGDGAGEAPALMMVSPIVACRVDRIPETRVRIHTKVSEHDKTTPERPQ